MANGFLRRRRDEELKAAEAAKPKAVEEEKAPAEPITGPTLNAPMGGRVITVDVKPGDAVKKGQTLLVYEAMKMENDVTAERDGVVKRILVQPDDVVSTDQPMIEFE